MANEKDRNEGKIYIRKITKDVTEKMVRDHFTQYGEVAAVDIKRGRFGFVTFRNPSVVNTVLQNEHTINGKLLNVQKALPREQNASCDASMADTRSREDKIAEQMVCASSAATSMAIQGGGGANITGFSGPALNLPEPSSGGVVSAASMDQPPIGTSTAVVSAASMDLPPSGTSTAVVSAASMDLPPSGTSTALLVSAASMDQPPIGTSTAAVSAASMDLPPSGTSTVVVSAATMDQPPIGHQSYSNITGIPDATWRTESSQGAAGYEAIGQGNVATPPPPPAAWRIAGTSSSSGGGGSAPIAPPRSLWPSHVQYERQSFATNFDRHGTSGGGSQECQASTSTLDGNTSVPQQQTTAAHFQYPVRFGAYIINLSVYLEQNPIQMQHATGGMGYIMEPLNPNAVLMTPSEAAAYGYISEMDRPQPCGQQGTTMMNGLERDLPLQHIVRPLENPTLDKNST